MEIKKEPYSYNDIKKPYLYNIKVIIKETKCNICGIVKPNEFFKFNNGKVTYKCVKCSK